MLLKKKNIVIIFIFITIVGIFWLLQIKKIISNPLDVYNQANNRALSIDSTNIFGSTDEFEIFILAYAFNNLRKPYWIDSVCIIDKKNNFRKKLSYTLNEFSVGFILGRNSSYISTILGQEDIIRFKESFKNNTIEEIVFSSEGSFNLLRNPHLDETVPIVLENYPPYYKSRIRIKRDTVRGVDSLCLVDDTTGSWSISKISHLLLSIEHPSGKIDTIFKDVLVKNTEYDEVTDSSYSYDEYRPLSVMGPFLSYFSESGGHFSTIDLRTKERISLDQFFQEEDIRKALLGVPLIYKSLYKELNKEDTLSLSGILKNLIGGRDEDFSSLLYDYRITKVTKDSVAIMFGIPKYCETFTLKFKMPDTLYLYTKEIWSY